MHCVAGIDPGLTGAVVVLAGAAPRQRLYCFDMPVHRLRIGKSVRKRIDIAELLVLMHTIKAIGPDLVVLEEVGGITGQSASTSFSFGKTAGITEAAIVAARLPLQLVTPLKWQKALGVAAGHDNAKLAAARCFPGNLEDWKKDGRAAASLLALYGARYIQSWA